MKLTRVLCLRAVSMCELITLDYRAVTTTLKGCNYKELMAVKSKFNLPELFDVSANKSKAELIRIFVNFCENITDALYDIRRNPAIEIDIEDLTVKEFGGESLDMLYCLSMLSYAYDKLNAPRSQTYSLITAKSKDNAALKNRYSNLIETLETCISAKTIKIKLDTLPNYWIESNKRPTVEGVEEIPVSGTTLEPKSVQVPEVVEPTFKDVYDRRIDYTNKSLIASLKLEDLQELFLDTCGNVSRRKLAGAESNPVQDFEELMISLEKEIAKNGKADRTKVVELHSTLVNITHQKVCAVSKQRIEFDPTFVLPTISRNVTNLITLLYRTDLLNYTDTSMFKVTFGDHKRTALSDLLCADPLFNVGFSLTLNDKTIYFYVYACLENDRCEHYIFTSYEKGVVDLSRDSCTGYYTAGSDLRHLFMLAVRSFVFETGVLDNPFAQFSPEITKILDMLIEAKVLRKKMVKVASYY